MSNFSISFTEFLPRFRCCICLSSIFVSKRGLVCLVVGDIASKLYHDIPSKLYI